MKIAAAKLLEKLTQVMSAKLRYGEVRVLSFPHSATLQEFWFQQAGALKNIVLGLLLSRDYYRIIYVPASLLVGLLEELGKACRILIWFFIAFHRMREKTVYGVKKGMQGLKSIGTMCKPELMNMLRQRY